jgi:hypothetical protein
MIQIARQHRPSLSFELMGKLIHLEGAGQCETLLAMQATEFLADKLLARNLL